MNLRSLLGVTLLICLSFGCSGDSSVTPQPTPDPYEVAARELVQAVESALNSGGVGFEDLVTDDFRSVHEPPWGRVDGVWDAEYETRILARMFAGDPGQRIWDGGQRTIPTIDSLRMSIEFKKIFALRDPVSWLPDGRYVISAETHARVHHADGTQSEIAELSLLIVRPDATDSADEVVLRLSAWQLGAFRGGSDAEIPAYCWGSFKSNWRTYQESSSAPPAPAVQEARFVVNAGDDRNLLRLTWSVPECDAVWLYAYWLEVGPTAAALADGNPQLSHEIFRSYDSVGDDRYSARIEVDDVDLEAFQWGRLIVRAYNRQQTIGEVFPILDPR